jgi:hypothetical protein
LWSLTTKHPSCSSTDQGGGKRRGCRTLVFYYGVRSIPRPWSLVKDDLDEHFGFPVAEKIEQANDYFRTRLYALLDAA